MLLYDDSDNESISSDHEEELVVYTDEANMQNQFMQLLQNSPMRHGSTKQRAAPLPFEQSQTNKQRNCVTGISSSDTPGISNDHAQSRIEEEQLADPNVILLGGQDVKDQSNLVVHSRKQAETFTTKTKLVQGSSKMKFMRNQRSDEYSMISSRSSA